MGTLVQLSDFRKKTALKEIFGRVIFAKSYEHDVVLRFTDKLTQRARTVLVAFDQINMGNLRPKDRIACMVDDNSDGIYKRATGVRIIPV